MTTQVMFSNAYRQLQWRLVCEELHWFNVATVISLIKCESKIEVYNRLLVIHYPLIYKKI